MEENSDDRERTNSCGPPPYCLIWSACASVMPSVNAPSRITIFVPCCRCTIHTPFVRVAGWRFTNTSVSCSARPRLLRSDSVTKAVAFLGERRRAALVRLMTNCLRFPDLLGTLHFATFTTELLAACPFHMFQYETSRTECSKCLHLLYLAPTNQYSGPSVLEVDVR